MTNAERFGPTHRSDFDVIDNRLTRVELCDADDGASWWIVHYASPIALTQGFATEVVGPYETQAQAIRLLNSTDPSTANWSVRPDPVSRPRLLAGETADADVDRDA